MRITLVKKIKADGSPCRKCAEVVERLDKAQLLGRMDRVVVADERDPDSEGMQLAGDPWAGTILEYARDIQSGYASR